MRWGLVLSPEYPTLRVIEPLELAGWMKLNGITDEHLARVLGIARFTVFRWRHGMTVPPPYLPFTLSALRREGLLEPSASPVVARLVRESRRALLRS